MNGIHLIKNDRRGVTTQFYALLITALLHLHLKQDILEQCESRENPEVVPKNETSILGKTKENQGTNVEVLEASLEDDIPSARDFINVLGSSPKKYWKISISWLKALQSLLAQPFDERAIEILGKL